MLHKQAVPERALELLKAIQANPIFERTRLVGGTALALQLGHRISIDLDFFGEIPFAHEVIANELSAYGAVTNLQNTRTIKIFKVDDVKIDFVHFTYNWLEAAIEDDGLRLAGKKDIAAMKISAITGRGSKKDFVDLHALLDFFSMQEMLDYFTRKFPDSTAFLAYKSLHYFADADLEKAPEMLSPYNWEAIKERIFSEMQKLSI